MDGHIRSLQNHGMVSNSYIVVMRVGLSRNTGRSLSRSQKPEALQSLKSFLIQQKDQGSTVLQYFGLGVYTVGLNNFPYYLCSIVADLGP